MIQMNVENTRRILNGERFDKRIYVLRDENYNIYTICVYTLDYFVAGYCCCFSGNGQFFSPG